MLMPAVMPDDFSIVARSSYPKGIAIFSIPPRRVQAGALTPKGGTEVLTRLSTSVPQGQDFIKLPLKPNLTTQIENENFVLLNF